MVDGIGNNQAINGLQSLQLGQAGRLNARPTARPQEDIAARQAQAPAQIRTGAVRPAQAVEPQEAPEAMIGDVHSERLVNDVQKVANKMGYMPMSNQEILRAYRYGEGLFVDRHA